MTKFPILSTNEIIQELNSWKIRITKAELTSPRREFILRVYPLMFNLINENDIHKNIEDLIEGEDAVAKSLLYSFIIIRKIGNIIGIPTIQLSNILHPTAKDVIHYLSAYINLIRFHTYENNYNDILNEVIQEARDDNEQLQLLLKERAALQARKCSSTNSESMKIEYTKLEKESEQRCNDLKVEFSKVKSEFKKARENLQLELCELNEMDTKLQSLKLTKKKKETMEKRTAELNQIDLLIEAERIRGVELAANQSMLGNTLKTHELLLAKHNECKDILDSADNLRNQLKDKEAQMVTKTKDLNHIKTQINDFSVNVEDKKKIIKSHNEEIKKLMDTKNKKADSLNSKIEEIEKKISEVEASEQSIKTDRLHQESKHLNQVCQLQNEYNCLCSKINKSLETISNKKLF